MPRLRKVLTLVLVAALVAIVAWVYRTLDRVISEPVREAVAQAPAHWMDSLRAVARVPAQIAGLALPRTEDGDGAPMLLLADTTNGWRPPAGLANAYTHLDSGTPPTAADSAVWRAVAADTALGRFVRAARQKRWGRLAMVERDTAATGNVFLMPIPSFTNTLSVARALAIRAQARLAQRDRRGAEEDLRAVVGLGEQMARHDPSGIGNLQGVGMIRVGATGLARLSAAVRDTALAARATTTTDWAKHRPGQLFLVLVAYPDSGLALAGDSSIALAWRAQGLLGLVLGPLTHARGVLFGLPGGVTQRIAPFARDRDSTFAHLAAMIGRTAVWVDHGGPKRRLEALNAF